MEVGSRPSAQVYLTALELLFGANPSTRITCTPARLIQHDIKSPPTTYRGIVQGVVV